MYKIKSKDPRIGPRHEPEDIHEHEPEDIPLLRTLAMEI